MITPLTARQAEVLAFIQSFLDEHEYAPSVREIGSHFDITPAGVQSHLAILERRGAIRRDLGVARSIRVLE